MVKKDQDLGPAYHLRSPLRRSLPVDRDGAPDQSREVKGACFSTVAPAPLDKPRLVAVSSEALALLGLPPSEARESAGAQLALMGRPIAHRSEPVACSPEQAERPDFADYFSGNRLLPGSDPAAHCYAGHQFGHFAGQLGDGAAMYLGEVVNGRGQRWGKTNRRLAAPRGGGLRRCSCVQPCAMKPYSQILQSSSSRERGRLPTLGWEMDARQEDAEGPSWSSRGELLADYGPLVSNGGDGRCPHSPPGAGASILDS